MNLGKQGLAVLVVWTLSAGCSVNLVGEVTTHRAIEGHDIDRTAVDAIVPGTTTKREIVDRFGTPQRTTTKPDGSDEYVYEYSGVIERKNEKVVWARSILRDERKRLRVVLAGDVVREFAYTNANIPEENRSQQVGSAETHVKTTEGRVEFTNEVHRVHLDVASGLAANVATTPSGRLDVGIPADNPSPLRMRVRERFASIGAGTEFSSSVAGEETQVAVKRGRIVVRSRTGCEPVDAGSEQAIRAPASETPAPIREITFPKIHYGFKSAAPVADDAPLVDCVADVLGDYPGARVRIEGHSDNVGSQGFNLRLSNRRAEAIRRALVASGIDASRLEMMGYGRTRPVASNATENGRAANRRVEFTVVAAP